MLSTSSWARNCLPCRSAKKIYANHSVGAVEWWHNQKCIDHRRCVRCLLLSSSNRFYSNGNKSNLLLMEGELHEASLVLQLSLSLTTLGYLPNIQRMDNFFFFPVFQTWIASSNLLFCGLNTSFSSELQREAMVRCACNGSTVLVVPPGKKKRGQRADSTDCHISWHTGEIHSLYTDFLDKDLCCFTDNMTVK